MNEITVVIGVDQNTAQQLAVSIPTWRKYRAEMFGWPWVLFYDRLAPLGIRPDDAQRLADEIVKVARCRIVEWPPGNVEYETPREKMVTGFVFVPPEFVQTDYWMKIDTDVLALGPADWFDEQWFARRYVWIAPSWGYTKAKGGGGKIVEWADRLETFGDRFWPRKPRLDLASKISGKKIKMSRMCSWVSYYDTNWTKRMAANASEHCGEHRLPVPSQDTFHWYCSARSQELVAKINMKKRLWNNFPRMANLQKTAAEVINA